MLKNFFFINFVLFSMSVFSQVGEDAVLGNWLATDHSVAVEVFKVNNKFRARVIWFDDRLGSGKPMNSRHDTENPNPNLRKRKIIGMDVLDGLQYDPQKNSWENGEIYDASTGRTWDSSASFTKEGILKVRGYWKFKWIGKSLGFKKTNQTAFKKE